MSQAPSLDLFECLRQLGRGNVLAWDQYSSEQQKQFSPFLTYMWLQSAVDFKQLKQLNKLPYTAVGSCKRLAFTLQAGACTNKTAKYSWIHPKAGDGKLHSELLMQRLGCSQREADMYLPLLRPDQLKQYALDLGWEDEKIKKL